MKTKLISLAFLSFVPYCHADDRSDQIHEIASSFFSRYLRQSDDEHEKTSHCLEPLIQLQERNVGLYDLESISRSHETNGVEVMIHEDERCIPLESVIASGA